MIAIVIPYFQREAGVLRRAIKSVLAQRDCTAPLHLIVVDDSSPVPASSELEGLDLGGLSLDLLFQANAGPGAARNTGLERLPPSAQFVAFLDSDDEWAPDHLVRAVSALSGGHDVFFANLLQLDQNVGAFERAGRLAIESHPVIAGFEGLHSYAGDMFDQVLRGNVIGTPTVVLRCGPLSKQRFRTDLTTAGEDYLFWMALAKAGARFCFSTRVGARCGRGVNIYAGVQWSTDAFFTRVRHELAYRKATQQLFELNAVQREHVRSSVQTLRRQFVQALLSRLRNGPRLPMALVLAMWRLDSYCFWAFPWLCVRAVLRPT